jgi:hypothetical protein
MVRRAASLVLLASLAQFLPAQPASPPAPQPAAYQIGDRAAQDVITPMPLMVVDQAATEALRAQAAQQIPPFFCYYPIKTEEAVSEFKTALNNTRYGFLEAKLADKTQGADTNGPLSGPAVAAFRAQNTGFPAGEKLLASWAANQGDDLQDSLVATLRAAMARHIRAANLPAALKLNDHARLLTITDPLEIPKLDTAEQQAADIPARTDLVTLEQARADLVNSFPAKEAAVGRFMAGFLRANTEPDMALTRASRDRETTALLSADSYDAGQVIIKHGQIVTARIKAALDQLNDKLQTAARAEQLQQQAVQSQTQAVIANERNRWLSGTLLAVVVAGGLTVRWQIKRWNRRRRTRALAVRVAGMEETGVVISCPTCAEHIVVPLGMQDGSGLPSCDHATHEEWRRRAIAAEQRAQQATAIVRTGMISHLAKYLSTELVRKLVSQRGDLIDVQRQAAERVEQLAGRLENLELPGRESELFYQQRIADLEQQLEESNELNRSLIKLKIATARRQLDEAKSQAGLN